jgi:hypothetical protein
MSEHDPRYRDESAFAQFASRNLYLLVYIAIVSTAVLVTAIAEWVLR